MTCFWWCYCLCAILTVIIKFVQGIVNGWLSPGHLIGIECWFTQLTEKTLTWTLVRRARCIWGRLTYILTSVKLKGICFRKDIYWIYTLYSQLLLCVILEALPDVGSRWIAYISKFMMTSSNRNIFRVTGQLCGEFTGPQWIPLTKASDAELWCLSKRLSKQSWCWWLEMLWRPLWRHCNVFCYTYFRLYSEYFHLTHSERKGPADFHSRVVRELSLVRACLNESSEEICAYSVYWFSHTFADYLTWHYINHI